MSAKRIDWVIMNAMRRICSAFWDGMARGDIKGFTFGSCASYKNNIAVQVAEYKASSLLKL